MDGETNGSRFSGSDLLVANLQFVDHVIAYLARRHALDRWDAQDFGSWVKLRLIEGDYRILRKFEGRSKLTTYLTTVINNLYRDFRIQRWGKWRASAAAKRHGEVGIRLESLLYRDGYTLSEAVGILRENHDVAASEEELEAIASDLKPRTRRRFDSDEGLDTRSGGERADESLLRMELASEWRSLFHRVERSVRALDPEDRRILTLRFQEDLSVAAIARELDLDQRRLYVRLHRLLAGLRRDLTANAPAQVAGRVGDVPVGAMSGAVAAVEYVSA